jgi:2-dehydropantoate 2-reductase
MRICVFGAGAIGGHVAACLVRGGADVSVVARGAHLNAMRNRGLTVRAPGGETHVRVAASADTRTLGVQDAVLVTVKAPALPSVAAAIGPLLAPQTPVGFLMNGIPWWYFDRHGGELEGMRLNRLDPGEAMRNAVGPERAIGGVVYSACTVLEPGVISVERDRNRLVLGEPNGDHSERLQAIVAPLRAGGFQVDVTDRIRDAIWCKLLMNFATGPLAVLAQSAPKACYAEPGCVAAVRAIIAEGIAIAASLGCTATLEVENQIKHGRTMNHKPSILQDLELGRPMEIDGIFAQPLELARLRGVPAPTLDLLVALMKARARAAGLYPD